MKPTRQVLVASLAATVLAMASMAEGAPRHGGSGYRHAGGSGHGHGYHGGAHWGWGIALGVPWALGWYAPYGAGGAYYPYPAYGYAPPYAGYGYGYGCGPFGECGRDPMARMEPTPPTTEVPPAAPGEEGGPTQRPLHLNYCESARAWFPHVRTCPGGWRLVRPEYSAPP
jgi:hypothetical protein